VKGLIILIWFVSDVKFLFLAPGSKDNYKELVDNPTNDIITFVSLETDIDKSNAISQVIDRIKQGKLSLHKQKSPFTTEKAGLNSKVLNFSEH
jgi:hypothetical protein